MLERMFLFGDGSLIVQSILFFLSRMWRGHLITVAVDKMWFGFLTVFMEASEVIKLWIRLCFK